MKLLIVAIALLVTVGIWLARRPAEVIETPPVVTEDPPPVELITDIEDPPPEVDEPPPVEPPEVFFAPVVYDTVAAGLEAAETALADGRLVAPVGDNAVQYFRGVLELDPENVDAQEGLAAATALLFAELTDAVSNREVLRARRLIRTMQSLEVEEQQYAFLAERTDAIATASRLLRRAEQAVEDGRLVGPDRTAIGYLKQAVALDPGHPAADALSDRLLSELIQRALASARNDQFTASRRWLAWASEARDGSVLVADAENRIDNLYARRVMDYRTRFDAALDVAQFESAVALMGEFEDLGAPPEALAQWQVDLEHARLYGRYAPGQVFVDALSSGGFGPQMVVLPVGSFMMGAARDDAAAESHEQPRHRVRIGRGFALGMHEVSVEQFGIFAAATGYETTAETRGYSFAYNQRTGQIIRRRDVTWKDDFAGREADPNMPVVHVDWDDARAYAAWLSDETSWRYRLPAEAQFEYAMRAGSQSIYWWGDGSPQVLVENLTGEGDSARRSGRTWERFFKDYSDGHWGTAPVMSFAANPFGLFDMAGNVAEWTEDCWHDSYARAPADGRAWVNPGCERRVARGGFWGAPPELARSSYRHGYAVSQRGGSLGFRVARDLLPVVARNALVDRRE